MGVMGLAMLIVFPIPVSASLPYVMASGLLHLGYNLFLARSYRTGDLSQVYPIARGAAPLLTLIVSWFVVHEDVGVMGSFGIAVLVAGIWLISIAGRRALRLDGKTLFFALGTSVFIAAYTIVDGLGGRLSGSPSGYAAILFVIDALMLSAVAVGMRGPGVFAQVAPHWKSGTLGAFLSASAYWIVIWAMTHAPIATVAALRETSILFVVVMSMKVLKETVTLPRISGALLIAAGAIVMRMA